MLDYEFENFNVDEVKHTIAYDDAKITMIEDLIDQIYRYPLGE